MLICTYEEKIYMRQKKRSWISILRRDVWRDKYLYIMFIPGLLLMIIFRYLPMMGLVIAFKDYSFRKGISGSEWVGIKHFIYIFTKNLDFYNILRNTMIINLYKLLFYFPAPLFLAILINEINNIRLKRYMQTAMYLPHFVSWVVFGTIVTQFLSPGSGIVNEIIKAFGGDPIFFMQKSRYFRGVVIFSEIWKSAGWGTILYLAALTSIDQEQYEAAHIDGANRLQTIWHISIPGISDTIVVLLLLQIGQLMDVGFEQIYVLAKPIVYDVGDVISTYIYRVGIGQGQFSMTAAIGLFQSIVGLVLIVAANYFCKKLFDKNLW